MFGSGFFNFFPQDDDANTVSPLFWVYWLAAGTLTIFTLGFWYWFSKRHTLNMKSILPGDLEGKLLLSAAVGD